MTTNTTPSPASQAPAVSIDDPELEFRNLQAEYATSTFTGFNQSKKFAAVVNFIDAKLAQARDDGIRISLQDRQESERGSAVYWKDRAEKSLLQASAAEAKLEAIRHGVEDLLQYILDHDWGGIPEPVLQIAALRAIFQQQPQADESGLPG